jgi:HEAT repeat protein
VAYTLPILGLTEDSLSTMRELTRDTDSEVRDWATFGLAQSDADDAATRQALFARIDDLDDDTRAEAMYGLAKRGDERVRDPLRLELEREDVGSLFVEAAALIGMTMPAAEYVARPASRPRTEQLTAPDSLPPPRLEPWRTEPDT